MSAPLVFSFVAGPVVDRSNKVKIMRLTTLLEFGVLALLTFTPLLENLGVMFMFGVIIVFSIASLFEGPSGTALLPHIVGDDDILPANSLINIASLLAGILLAILLFGLLADGENLRLIYGLSTCFLACAVAFSLFMRDPSTKNTPADAPKHGFLSDLLVGVKFLRKNILLFFLIAYAARTFVGQIAYVNMPAFIEYYAGAQGYILISVVSMVGGLIASSLVGTLGKKFKVGQMMLVLFVLTGVSRVAFALLLPESFYGALVIVVMFSTFVNASGIVYGSLEQKLPPKDMVGRVDTMSTTFLAIFVALGALSGGFIGRVVPNVAYILITQGILIVLTGMYLILVPAVRKLPKIDDISRTNEDFDVDTEIM